MESQMWSHPNKPLIKHIEGILSHCSENDLIKLAVLFHDLGKMGSNFQKKIRGREYNGYSHHGHLSSYFLIIGFVNNKDDIIKALPFVTDENWKIVLIILANIIVGHHGYLRNIGELFNEDEWDRMIEHLKTDDISKKANDFYDEHKNLLGLKINFLSDHENNRFYKTFQNLQKIQKYHKNALDYHFSTLMTYAELVNGDRRDASGNEIYYREKNREKYNFALENNLEWLFRKFNKGVLSELNIVRNEISEECEKKLTNILEENPEERVFTLTAPTAAGKTLLMLKLALRIMKMKGVSKYDIMYSIPFLSIADQTSTIINDDLRIETLNYTSSSDTSETLQHLIEKTENGESKSKELMNYAFSENSLDHPFVLTTFNQIFETFLSNSTSKVLKMKYFKNRIFLIDEYQALQAGQYYIMLRMLQKFCVTYDSYAIISTATMPYFDIDLKKNGNNKLDILFGDKKPPIELLSHKIFENKVFDRYVINFIGEGDTGFICNKLQNENNSVLCIMNTIRSSNNIFAEMFQKNKFEKIYLLNASISPFNRKEILSEIKKNLKENIKILVISTQVVEAGVDISFPIVYRDAAPPSSITQSGGRCNRSWEYNKGEMYVFLYKDPDPNIKQYDCDMVYHGRITKAFKNDVKNKISPMSEKEFHMKCNRYFFGLAQYIEQGITESGFNIVDSILNGRFGDLREYKVIESNPNAETIFVGEDELWKEYIKKLNDLNSSKDYTQREITNVEFKKIRSKILQKSVTVQENIFDLVSTEEEPVFGVYKLKEPNQYNSIMGLIISR